MMIVLHTFQVMGLGSLKALITMLYPRTLWNNQSDESSGLVVTSSVAFFHTSALNLQ